MKKSPKNVEKWLSYCNFSFEQSNFYFFPKITPLQKCRFFYFEIQISKRKFYVRINLMVLPGPEDQGDKDYVKKVNFQVSYVKFSYVKFPFGKLGRRFFNVWVRMG